MAGFVIGYMLGTLLSPLLVMAVIGGVYWLFVRPRVTFRQAMFRWWVVLSSVVLVVLSLVSRSLH